MVTVGKCINKQGELREYRNTLNFRNVFKIAFFSKHETLKIKL